MKEVLTLIADVFKDKLSQAGYKTIIRKERENWVDIHIQGLRKKHTINVYFSNYNENGSFAGNPDRISSCVIYDIRSFYIRLMSERMFQIYPIWKKENVNIHDPNFTFDFEPIIDKVLLFLRTMNEIDAKLGDAHKIFPVDRLSEKRSYDPNRTKVSKYHV